MTNFPSVPEDLLKSLDETFPERCPEASWSDRKIWMEAGARRVVRFLKAKYEEQQENILGETAHV